MIKPYLVDVKGRGNLSVFISVSNEILVYDDVYDEYLRYHDMQFVPVEKVHRAACKKELQDAGLWDLVLNKEDFSNIEEELEEYFRIGEELSKTKDPGEK